MLQNELSSLNNTKANITYVDQSISNLVGSAPATLNTLQEIANAIANDANFSVTLVNNIATKASKSYVDTELATLQTQINDRTTTNYVTSALSVKSDISYVNSGLATKTDVADFNTLSSTVSSLPTTSYVTSAVNGAKAYTDSSIVGLATNIYVDNKTQMVKDEILGGASTAFDTLLELQNALSNSNDAVSALTNSLGTKASTTYVDNSITNLQSNLITELNTKATSSDITNALTSYATQTYVETAITNNAPNLTNYALKSYVDTAVSNVSVDLTGYARTTYVNSYVSGLASQTYVTNAVANVKNDILGGAGPAYDTLAELNSLIQAGDSTVSTALTTQINAKANDNSVVHLTGTETIGGIKTFSNNVTVPSINNISSTTLGYLDATSSIQTQINAKANDNAVVHLTGTETIGGIKTFSNNITVPSINIISSTTLGYLDATSSIQTQINAKANTNAVVDLTTNQTIGGNKSLTGMTTVNEVAELITNPSITSNAFTANYSNGAIFYLTPASSTNLSCNITNIPTSQTYRTYTITLLIDSSTYKVYANTVTVNGTSYSPIYIGGSSAISITSATVVMQTLSIIFTTGSTPWKIISSVNSVQ